MSASINLPLALALTLAVAACGQQSADAPASGAASTASAVIDAATPEAREASAFGTAVDDAPIAAASGTYTIDPAHTDVLARWSHFGFSNPSAHFGSVSGTIVYNADDVSASSVQVTMPLSGVNSFTAKFDEHLRSADFFDAARFPQATFRSTSVAAAGNNRLTVAGDLTVKDITRPVTLDVTLNGAGPHPMANVPAIGFDATTTLMRSDFGVGAYAPNVSDEVEVRITTEATAAATDATAPGDAAAPAAPAGAAAG